MQSVTSSERGLALFLDLNWDLIVAVSMIAVALLAGTFLGTSMSGL